MTPRTLKRKREEADADVRMWEPNEDVPVVDAAES